MNKYYEAEIKVYLINNINVKNAYEKIAKLINYSFNNSQFLSCLHLKKGLKHYSFSGLYPIEKDRIYKVDEIYSFLLRSYNKQFIIEFMKNIQNLENEDFIVTETSLKHWKHKDIYYIDNITPTIITLKNNLRWNKEKDGLEIANKSIFNNLIKKYNLLNGTSFQFNYEDIIKDIKVKNKVAIIVNYKGIKFLGYKFRIYFQNNPIAQEIANHAVVEGIGEKNSSFGMGFVKPYFRRK